MFKNLFTAKARRTARKNGQTVLDLLRSTMRMSKTATRTCVHLIENGADLTLKENGGRTALMLAARDGRTHIVETLLRHGAKTEDKDSKGRTALMHAIGNSSTENINTILALLKHGADASTQTDKGVTALMRSIWNRNERTAQALLDHGADTTPKAPENHAFDQEKTAEDIARDLNLTALAQSIRKQYVETVLRAAAEHGTTRTRKIHRVIPPATRQP
ncbi:MAG: ankyrin repeat domain-containing protein [Alphaproteobacteria bacterium]|nr:ankyrin repeat domain-containing protein [Alphaproteobacteria bacterium]